MRNHHVVHHVVRNVALAALLALAGSTLAQDATAPYTQAQADRGAETYAARCASCHGAELEGMAHFPTLTGPEFRAEWSEKGVAALHAYIHANMPLGQGGSLSDEAYLDLVAFLLASNGVAPDGGDAELTVGALEGVVLPADGATSPPNDDQRAQRAARSRAGGDVTPGEATDRRR